MSKVTSKLQVTIPKRIAEEYGIEPGDEIEFVAAADTIRVIPPGRARQSDENDIAERLHRFDAATTRQAERQRRRRPRRTGKAKDRAWTREELYDRAPTR